MIYNSLILFCGFITFTGSDFGGTVALGILTSITLIVAMLTNTMLLPSLLLTIEGSIKKSGTKQEKTCKIKKSLNRNDYEVPRVRFIKFARNRPRNFKFWEEENIFEKVSQLDLKTSHLFSLRDSSANGMPGIHHVMEELILPI